MEIQNSATVNSQTAVDNSHSTGASHRSNCSCSTTATNNIYDLATNDHGWGVGKGLRELFRGSPAPQETLSVETNEALKEVHIKTEDGYTISITGKNQGWGITSPDGRTTKIWGDPHVDESDGDRWDFKDQSTFVFGNNKITVETTPYRNTDQTLTKTITIYNGDDRLSVTDIDKDRPRLVGWDFDASAHDAQLDDGDVYNHETTETSEAWIKA